MEFLLKRLAQQLLEEVSHRSGSHGVEDQFLEWILNSELGGGGEGRIFSSQRWPLYKNLSTLEEWEGRGRGGLLEPQVLSSFLAARYLLPHFLSLIGGYFLSQAIFISSLLLRLLMLKWGGKSCIKETVAPDFTGRFRRASLSRRKLLWRCKIEECSGKNVETPSPGF